jgi:hypothetical protein
MKGKKTDPIFVASFIAESVLSGAETPEQIVVRAKQMIIEIDDRIKAVEASKKIRTKLLDVIASFEAVKKDRAEDAKLLPFFELKYPQRCKELCDLIKEMNSLPVLSWAAFGDKAAEHNFCIKQLIEFDIFVKIGDQLSQGERFDEYMKFILQEAI